MREFSQFYKKLERIQNQRLHDEESNPVTIMKFIGFFAGLAVLITAFIQQEFGCNGQFAGRGHRKEKGDDDKVDFANMLDYGVNGQGRITQFESGYRNPNKATLEKIAAALDCNQETLMDVTGKDASELMQMFFWMEEDNPATFHVFQFRRIPGERVNTSDDPGVYYHDNDHWPAHEPFGFWLDYPLLNDFMQEWVFHKQELADGIITREEYFEWKINWPYTCDDCNRRIPAKDWRKPKNHDAEDVTNE